MVTEPIQKTLYAILDIAEKSGKLLICFGLFLIVVTLPLYVVTLIYNKKHPDEDMWWWDKEANEKYFK